MNRQKKITHTFDTHTIKHSLWFSYYTGARTCHLDFIVSYVTSVRIDRKLYRGFCKQKVIQ